MHVVRDRGEARWLPSRHRYALARLIAFLRLRGARSEPHPGLVLAVDRDQSAAENMTLGFAVWIIWTCYAVVILPGAWKVTAPIVAHLGLQLVLVGTILLLHLFGRDLWAFHHRINSVLMFVLLLLASSYFAATQLWVRFVAWIVLAAFVLNAVAAAVLFLLRRSVRELEARCGA